MFKLALFILASVCFANAQKFPIKAVAMIGGGLMNPRTQEPIMIFGDVKFIQLTAQAPVTIKMNISFFPNTDILVNEKRGIHVHTFGVSDVSPDPSKSCESTGPHWNPTGSAHGSINNLKSHHGDLGNVEITPVNGKILVDVSSPKLKLFGEDSIIGRSVVLHQNPDDEGLGASPMSSKNGNSGNRIACGTIGLMQN